MNSKLTPEHWGQFTAHTLHHLPDSIRDRKVVLHCLIDALPHDHPQRDAVIEVLHHAVAHERRLAALQAELPLFKGTL